MKGDNINTTKRLKDISLAVFISLLTFGIAVLGMAGIYHAQNTNTMDSVAILFEMYIFVMGFALPIIGIAGIIFVKYLRKNIWIFIPVSILDALFCYLATNWLTINLLQHGSEYTWWGFRLLWYGKILIVNGSFLLIILLVCWVTKDKKVDEGKATEGADI